MLNSRGDEVGSGWQSGDDLAALIGASRMSAQFIDMGAWLDPASGNLSMATAVMNAAWLSDQERRKLEYDKYKDFQKRGYGKDPDDCRRLKNRIEFTRKLVLMRHAWDMRWMSPKYPGGGMHAAANAKDWAELKVLEERLRRECPHECE